MDVSRTQSEEQRRATLSSVLKQLRTRKGLRSSELARQMSVSGRTYLYLSTPKRCAQISGTSPEQAADTVDFLFAHSTRSDNVYRHTWEPGDIVMWDNRCVLHCADHAGVLGDRVMHRGMVAD